MVSPLVTTEIISLDEFPELGSRYSVTGVPKTVINDRVEFDGAATEEYLIDRILSVNR